MTDGDFKFLEKSKFVPTEDELKNIPKDSSKVSAEFAEGVSGVFFEPKAVSTEVVPPATPPAITGNELSTDYQYVRTNLYAITERSIDALNNLVQIADQSQHPRAYEVVALLVNTIASAQKDLMTIHSQKAKIEGTVAKNQPDVINNNLFVGNTAQLDENVS